MSAHDVLDERVTGGASLLPVKLTPQMAAMSRHQPFSHGSSTGEFGQIRPFTVAANISSKQPSAPARPSSQPAQSRKLDADQLRALCSQYHRRTR